MDAVNDILAQFNSQFSSDTSSSRRRQRKNEDESYPYHTLKMWYGANVVIGRLIPDTSNRMYRGIQNVIEYRLPTGETDDEGNQLTHLFRWCSSNNYNDLSAEDKALNEKVIDLWNRYCELRDGDETFKYFNSPWLILQYVKIKKVVNTSWDGTENNNEYSNPDVTVVLHKSVTYLRSFGEFINQKIKAKGVESGTKWLNKCFNRSPEELETNIQLSSRLRDPNAGEQPGYQVDISMDDSYSIGLTTEDLEATQDLGKEWISEKFDKEIALGHIKALQDAINTLGGLNETFSKTDPLKPKESDSLDDLEFS